MRDSTLGNHVNAIVRTIAALCLLTVGLGISGGCSMSQDQRMVGIYSVDPVRSELPSTTSRDIERKFRDITRNAKLKLHSDHGFVLSSARVIEGTWRTEGDLLYLKPKAGAMPDLLLLMGDQPEIPIRIGSNYGLLIDRGTELGNMKIRFRKTG